MMICPQSYLEEHKGDTFDKLLKERDSLIREIRAFEKKKIPAEQWMIYPKPDVIYQMNLQYLSVLCDYIAERYLYKRQCVY